VDFSHEPRHHRKFEQQKQLLLASANQLFALEGYNSVTVRRIAEQTGLSPGTFYTYFKDKTDVLKHLCEETFAGLNHELDEVESKKSSPLETLLEASRAFCRFGTANPHHFKVFLMASSDFGDLRAVEFIGEMGMASFMRLRRIYESAAFPDMTPLGSILWWNSLKGIIDFINLHAHAPWFDSALLIDTTIDTLLKGSQR
jgi:AcrR family transcriptional regulator